MTDVPDDDTAPVRPKAQRLIVQQHWGRAREVEIPEGSGAHGGGDDRMLADLFRGAGNDPLRRSAGLLDGVGSVVVGIAGNTSLETGLPVRTADLRLDLA